MEGNQFDNGIQKKQNTNIGSGVSLGERYNMRIGFDLTSLSPNRLGGGEYYIKNLLAGINVILSEYPKVEILLFGNSRYDYSQYIISDQVKLIITQACYSQMNFKSIVYLLGFPFVVMSHNVDIMFYPFPSRPLFHLGRVKTISVIHDIQHIILKQYATNTVRNIVFNHFIRSSLRHNMITITISDTVKSEIENEFNRDDRLVRIYNPIDFKKHNISIGRTHAHPYLLYVGSLQPHKNTLTIIKAMEHLYQKYGNSFTHELLIVGVKQSVGSENEDYIVNHNLSDKIHIIGPVSDELIVSYYKFADIFLFPSIYEGFGMPIIEAMYEEIPVLTTSESCIPEVSGGRAIYVKEYLSITEWAENIYGILNYTSQKSTQIVDNKKFVQRRYSIEVIAKLYLDLFLEAYEK